MEEYIKIDNVSNYVYDGLKLGKFPLINAEKIARVIAYQGQIGEEVISWSADSNGNEIKEKVSTVVLDSVTNEPGWILTKCTPDGSAIIDSNGHPNQWVVGDKKFKDKYEIDDKNPDLFKPVGGIQTFIQIPDNIILFQWGSEMKIASGGYINITNENDMYGISQRDFNDTYKILSDDFDLKLK